MRQLQKTIKLTPALACKMTYTGIIFFEMEWKALRLLEVVKLRKSNSITRSMNKIIQILSGHFEASKVNSSANSPEFLAIRSSPT